MQELCYVNTHRMYEEPLTASVGPRERPPVVKLRGSVFCHFAFRSTITWSVTHANIVSLAASYKTKQLRRIEESPT
jgi:hypothetical protein